MTCFISKVFLTSWFFVIIFCEKITHEQKSSWLETSKLTTCPCGRSRVEIPLTSSGDTCLKYKTCETCVSGLDRCLTCPPKKYGIWCEKDCKCQHGGFCNEHGTCICPKGFTGDFCDVKTKHIRVKNRKRRQDGVSPGLCPINPPPANGYIHLEKDSHQEGDAIKYTCKENYTMMGSRTRHCNRDGKWSGEAPTCEKMCSFPPTTEHMKVKANPYQTGSPLHDTFGNEVLAELEFSCSPGYSIIGAHRLRCASGVWDNDVPVCRLDTSCADPGIPENGFNTKEKTASDIYKLGNQITFGCAPNYTLVGFPTITCMPSGTWNPSIPTCIPNVIPTCTFTCKSDSIQTRLHQLDQPLACNVNGLENMAGNIVMIPEK